MLTIAINIILVVNVLVAILLILLTLMQRPKQEGLGAAFGSGMTDNLFGADTSNVLVKATRILGGTFLALSLLLSALYNYQASQKSAVSKLLPSAEAPAVPAPSPSPAPSPEAPATPAP